MNIYPVYTEILIYIVYEANKLSKQGRVLYQNHELLKSIKLLWKDKTQGSKIIIQII